MSRHKQCVLVQLFKDVFEEPGSLSPTPSLGHCCHSQGHKMAPSTLGIKDSKGKERGMQKGKVQKQTGLSLVIPFLINQE